MTLPCKAWQTSSRYSATPPVSAFSLRCFTGSLRPRDRKPARHDTVCHLSSTPHLKASPPCQQPQRGKVHLLCPRRRPYLYHFPAGFGTYCRITSPSTPMDLCDSLKKSFLLSMENHLHFTRESAIIRAYRISLCGSGFRR